MTKTSFGIITSFKKSPIKKFDSSTRLVVLLKTTYSRKEFKDEITKLRKFLRLCFTKKLADLWLVSKYG